MIKYKWKVCSIIICFVLLSIIIYTLDFALPKSVTAAIHLDTTDIYLCSVTINRKTGGSTDFKGKILEEFLEILEATEVRYLTTDLSIDTSLNATNYMLYLNSEEKTVSISVFSNGYMDYHGRRYAILPPKNGSNIGLVSFLQQNVGCDLEIKEVGPSSSQIP